MNMKYFRFLYGETAGCFMHFGELNDTLTKEKVTFLYLSGTGRKENQSEDGDSLFLCPKYMDLVVLGEYNAQIEMALLKLLEHTEIGTLVMPGVSENKMLMHPEGENLYSSKLPMHPEEESSCRSKLPMHPEEGSLGGNETVMCSEQIKTYFKDTHASIEEFVFLETNGCNSYKVTKCGWNFFVKSYTGGKLALLHAQGKMDGDCSAFDDCVMNVKVMHSGRKCLCTQETDGYGCALGCTLHQDYNECKYRRQGDSTLCRTGTLLVNGDTEPDFRRALAQESGIEEDEIRFYGISGEIWSEYCGSGISQNADKTTENVSETKYFIGLESEIEDAAAAEVCRSGLNHIPVLLKEGQGICCSGFLKYAQRK